MKYFYDTEFLEGKQRKTIFGIPFGKTKPTIDLISIGIVCEDGREYYAISKDFNLKEAWNRYDIEIQTFSGDLRNQYPNGRKQKKYWIRENVLKTIWEELCFKDFCQSSQNVINVSKPNSFTLFKNECLIFSYSFSYNSLAKLIKKYGKTNEQIAKEIYDFVNPDLGFHITAYNNSELKEGGRLDEHFSKHNVTSDGEYYFSQPDFYGYYSAYDHVVLCWLFGNMVDLPKGFPMFTIDLKQILDERASKSILFDISGYSLKDCVNDLKQHSDFPKQINEHNALADAKWNKDLFNFLEKIEYGTIIR